MYLRWAFQSLREAAWAPLFVFGLHLVAALVFDLYRRVPSFDIPMHLVGGSAIAFFFHRASMNASLYAVIGPFHPVTHWLLVLMATCTTAVFWEFAEFINDRYFGGHSQAGLYDTLGDMCLGIIGGAVFVIAAAIRMRRTTRANAAKLEQQI